MTHNICLSFMNNGVMVPKRVVPTGLSVTSLGSYHKFVPTGLWLLYKLLLYLFVCYMCNEKSCREDLIVPLSLFCIHYLFIITLAQYIPGFVFG
jgi:hypothetical protein